MKLITYLRVPYHDKQSISSTNCKVAGYAAIWLNIVTLHTTIRRWIDTYYTKTRFKNTQTFQHKNLSTQLQKHHVSISVQAQLKLPWKTQLQIKTPDTPEQQSTHQRLKHKRGRWFISKKRKQNIKYKKNKEYKEEEEDSLWPPSMVLAEQSIVEFWQLNTSFSQFFSSQCYCYFPKHLLNPVPFWRQSRCGVWKAIWYVSSWYLT